MDLMLGRSKPIKELSRKSKLILFAAMMAVIFFVGIVDYVTGSELAFSIFYLFPVGILAWYVGWEAGVTASVTSGIVWYIADTFSRTEPYSTQFIPAWNTAVRVLTFLIVTVLITILRETMKRETLNARVDPLTGASNARAFYEATETQISLLKRYQRSFSILYLDIDNFKQINDVRGHSAGDTALQDLVTTLKQNLRMVDTITRLGGDEFAILLAEADAGAADVVSSRIQSAIRTKLPCTCSMGVLTCSSPPHSVDELVEIVDNLMYEAKRGGKDRKMSSTFSGN